MQYNHGKLMQKFNANDIKANDVVAGHGEFSTKWNGDAWNCWRIIFFMFLFFFYI